MIECFELVGFFIGEFFKFMFSLYIAPGVSMGTLFVMLIILSIVLFVIFGTIKKRGD